MSRIIDLDAARAARAEAQLDAPVVRFNGKDYTLPVELPWSIVEAATSQDSVKIIAAVKTLLGEQWNDFQEANVSVADMTVLIESISQLYAVEPGN
jgi:hypothetical protein